MLIIEWQFPWVYIYIKYIHSEVTYMYIIYITLFGSKPISRQYHHQWYTPPAMVIRKLQADTRLEMGEPMRKLESWRAAHMIKRGA